METQEINLKVKAGSLLTYSWNVLWDKFITLFLVMLVVWVAYIPMSALSGGDHNSFLTSIFGTFGFLYFIFIMSPISYSADFLFLKAIRRAEVDVKRIFEVFNNYLTVVLANLLRIAIIGIGFVFLIIPGIVFACRLVLVPYLVMDKHLDPVKAVEESWRLTSGYGWRIFWMYLVSFFLMIAGLIVLVFGFVIALMWINAAFASLYQAIIQERGEYIVADDELINLENEPIVTDNNQ
ncbi:MAG: hypothetical protein WCX31_05110 [Salinivirgaceae bacterium]